MLIFSLRIEEEPSCNGAGGCSGDKVSALIERPAKIVGDRLPEVIAIAQGRSGDMHIARVDAFYLRLVFPLGSPVQLAFQSINASADVGVRRQILRQILGFLQLAEAFPLCPGLHRGELRANVSQSGEAL